jgi:VanZ family protein
MERAVRLLALIVVVGLLAAMLGPPAPIVHDDTHFDKVAHVVGFLAIALALQIGLVWHDRLGAALLALLIGAAVEVIQGFIGRDRSLGDLLADGTGVALAWLLAPRLTPILQWLRAAQT